MDKKTHYNEILDKMKLIYDKYEKYKDNPEEIIDWSGEKLGPGEEPKDIMAYAKLIKDIVQFSDKTEREKIRIKND